MKTEFYRKKNPLREESGGTLMVDLEISMYFWKLGSSSVALLEEDLAAPG